MLAEITAGAEALAGSARRRLDAMDRAEQALVAEAEAGRRGGLEDDRDRRPSVPSLPDERAVVNIGLPLFADAVADQGFDGRQRRLAHPRRRRSRRRRRPGAALRAQGRGGRRRQRRGGSAARHRRAHRSPVSARRGGRSRHRGQRRSSTADRPSTTSRRSTRCGARCARRWSPRGGPKTSATPIACWPSGEIGLAPANRHDTVVPMVTAVGPSQPVWVVENEAGGNRAFAPREPGAGRDRVVRARHARGRSSGCGSWRRSPGRCSATPCAPHGPIDVLGIAAQGLQMGDDVHIRVQASTNLLLRDLLPHLAALEDTRRVGARRASSPATTSSSCPSPWPRRGR